MENRPGQDAAAEAEEHLQTAPPQERDAAGRKLWRSGTLVYTFGGLVILFCWLLCGDFAWSMRERSVFYVVQLLLKRFGASDFVMSLLLSALPAAIGIFFGPVISYNSDRHRGRWGRRIPYILIATPVAALAMVGLAFSRPIAGQVHSILGVHAPGEETLTLLIFGMFWTIFELAAIAANAVFGALINDVVPRHLLGRFYGLFRAVSLLVAILFNYWLIGSAEEHCQLLFGGIAVLYGVGVVTMCMRVREGQYPPPPDVTPGERKSFFAAAKIYFQECFSKPYYVWTFLAMTLATLCFVPVNLFIVPFAQSVGVSLDLYGKCGALAYAISLCLAYFLGAIVDRFHPLRVGIVVLALYAVTTLWGGLCAKTPTLYCVAWVAHCVISGTYFTTSASLPQRLLPKSKFAQYASAGGILTAIATLGLSPLFGLVLDLSGHQYRYTFVMSCGLTVLAALLMIVVHAKFMRLGGPKNYVAPE